MHCCGAESTLLWNLFPPKFLPRGCGVWHGLSVIVVVWLPDKHILSLKYVLQQGTGGLDRTVKLMKNVIDYDKKCLRVLEVNL